MDTLTFDKGATVNLSILEELLVCIMNFIINSEAYTNLMTSKKKVVAQDKWRTCVHQVMANEKVKDYKRTHK
jgi:hypothetical protein